MKHVFSFIGVFVLGALIGAGISFAVKSAPTDVTAPTDLTKLRSGMSTALTETTERYVNSFYGFSIEHPKGLLIQQFNEEGDASTIVFQEEGVEGGFQVFIVPYTESTISAERIKQDLHGALMKDVQNIVLAGSIPAVLFSSEAPIIGPSREVWFIKNGYLFEFTTYERDEALLSETLATLHFEK